MILPIYLYGQPVLRKTTNKINPDYPALKELINNMFETMYNAEGVGLAAPQVGLDIKLFVVDLSPLAENNEEFRGFKKVFINADIIDFSEELITLREGCLSLPGINESVERPESIKIRYYDENFTEHEEEYEGFFARCIQHEYEHTEGKMFVDKISGIRKQLIKSKLNNFIKGRVNCFYKVKPVSRK